MTGPTLNSLLFRHLGITRVVVWYIDPRFNRYHHPRSERRVSVDHHGVMGVHTEVVAQVVGVQAVH